MKIIQGYSSAVFKFFIIEQNNFEKIKIMANKSCFNIDINKMKEFIEAVEKDPGKGQFTFKTNTVWQDGSVSKTTARDFNIITDEPETLGGKDSGIDPIELLLGSIASSIALGFSTQAAKKRIELKKFNIETEGDIDVRGYLGLSGPRPGFNNIRYTLNVESDASEEELEDSLRSAEETSPMYDNVSKGVPVYSEINKT